MFKVLVLVVLISFGLALEDDANENETITKLNLSNKGLTTLNDYDFTQYPQLEELDLSNNLIENIKQDKFIKNHNLKKLNLSGNTHLKLPQFATLLIANIEELNLSNCDIEVLPPSILDGLINLKIIDLSHNPLTSIKLITFTNLLKPEKIILPNLDNKETITEICNELNITIEDQLQILECADVRNGKWETVKKDDNLKPADVSLSPETDTDDAGNSANSKSIETSSKKTETNEIPAIIANLNNKEAVAEKNPAHTNDALSKTNEQAENHNTNETEQTIDVTNGTNEGIDANETPEIVVDEIPNSKTQENETPKIAEETNTVEIQNANDEVLATNNIKPSSVVTSQNDKTPQDTQSLTDKNPKFDIPITGIQDVPLARALPPPAENVNVNINNHIVPSVPEHTIVNAKIQETKEAQQSKQEDSSEASTGASTPASTGTNILVFLVVAVVIAGIAAFGYKFYKSRTYNTTNTHEPIERELKEIVTDKRSNGPTLSNLVEEEPLMLKTESSVEVKEVDETKENHSNNTNHVVSKPYIPITMENENTREK